MILRNDGQQLADLRVVMNAISQSQIDASALLVAQFQHSQPIVLMTEIYGSDGFPAPHHHEVLDETVIASGVPPSFDPPYIAAQFPGAGRFVRPDVAVTAHPVSAGVCFRSADVEGRGAEDGFFKGGSDPGEFNDVVAPFGADDGLAVARADAAKDIIHKGMVARGVTSSVYVERRTATHTVGAWGIRGVLLLEIDEALGDRGRVDAVADLHSTGWDVTKEIPPLGVIGKGRIGDSSNEAGNLEKVVDFSQVGVGEGVAGEAAEDAPRSQSAGGEDSLSDFAGWAVVAQENDTLLCKHGIDENEDGVGEGAAGGEV